MKKLFTGKVLAFFVLFLLSLISSFFLFKHYRSETQAGYQSPEIYIYGGEGGFSEGGLISQAATEEPSVQIGGYNISGNAEISIYKADKDSLLSYLLHDKDGKQIKSSPDVGKFQFVANTTHSINTGSYEGSKVPLPLTGVGVWYLKVKIGNINTDAFVLRSDFGVLAKEGDNEFIFWGQDFATKRSIVGGSVTVMNLQDSQKSISQVSFDSGGLARTAISSDADIALAEIGDDITITPLNLKYLNVQSYRTYSPKERNTNYFVFTDRPLYKPGDKVYFKAVLRDDDDARYTIPSGSALVKVMPSYGSDEVIYEKSYSVSSDGTVTGEYTMPADVKVGSYTLSVDASGGAKNVNYNWGESHAYRSMVYFDVQFYQKPEFSIDVTTGKTELIAGDKSSFKISGQYFSGQPTSGQKVKYTIYSSDYLGYQYLSQAQSLASDIGSEYKYGFYGSHKVIEDSMVLDKNGEANIPFDTKMDFNEGKNQVFSIEATIDDGSQSPSFARRNVLVYAGQFGIFRTDTSFGTKVGTALNLPVALYSYDAGANLSSVALTGKVHRTTWVKYQDPAQKYASYRKEEEDLADIKGTTDSGGKATLSFTPPKLGFYRITVQGHDSRGSLVANILYAYVTDKDQPAYTQGGGEEITVASDKQKYSSGDTASFSIYSAVPDRDVFFSLERGRVNRFQIVHLSGKSGSIDLPVVDTDVPNIYAAVSSFSSNSLDANVENVSVSTLGKKVIVSLVPDRATYGPGDGVSLTVKTKDASGNPLSADVAVWAVDKAIFELSDNKLGDIFEAFWSERGNTTQADHSLEGIVVMQAEGGGCFGEGTKVLMADGSLKNIEDVRPGEYVFTRSGSDSTKLVKAKVTQVHKAKESGYLIINGTLKITPDHILWVNGAWRQAGSIKPGDSLTNSAGNSVSVNTIEWQKGVFDVYNLDVARYHTYFADGVWVHNQKGEARSAFKDTAYWNPSVRTGSTGEAIVTFTLPDNLTTWTLAAVADTVDTKVGQTTAEITVTKDIIVRPILPNIMRVGDDIFVSSLVQNFTDSPQTLDINLEFDSGSILSTSFPGTVIASGDNRRFFWQVKPEKENGKAKITFSAKSKGDSKLGDSITTEIPVRAFGFLETKSESATGNKTYEIAVAKDVDKSKSEITLSLSPTMLGTLPVAMKYLIDYPYGCTEQIVSSLVPALIAKSNSQLFTEALKGKDINGIIQKAISKLESIQNYDGSYRWWFSGDSDPYITSYVVEYLVYAKHIGYKVNPQVLESAKNYLARKESGYNSELKKAIEFSDNEWVVKNYGLMLLDDSSDIKKIDNFDNLTPDLLSLAVITNYILGDKDPQTNGLNKLVSMAQTQGDGVYWSEGGKKNFGSRDASTALAIRAIITAGGDRELAVKAANFLSRNRRFNYWSNTFATSQVVRAITDLAKTGEESTPNFTYKVLMDGTEIKSGKVDSARDRITDIALPLDKVKDGGSQLEVSMSGTGQLYSTLLTDEFNTDKKAGATGNTLSIKREYVNEKGDQYALAAGDSVKVRLTVQGLNTTENYAVIRDELPSGMVPINPVFKNEQYGDNFMTSYFTSPDVTGMDVTENGAVISLYKLEPGSHTFTYRARIVSAGTFVTPPAYVSLMYAPEVYARTGVQTVKIENETKVIPLIYIQVLLKKYGPYAVTAALVIVSLGSVVMILKKRGFKFPSFKKKTILPPPPVTPTPPVSPPVQ